MLVSYFPVWNLTPAETRPALSDRSAGVQEEPSWDVFLPGSKEPVLSLDHQQGTLLCSSTSSSVTLQTTPWTPLSLFLQRKRLRFSDSQGNQARVFTVWLQSLLQSTPQVPWSLTLPKSGALWDLLSTFSTPEPPFSCLPYSCINCSAQNTHLPHHSSAHGSLASVSPWLPEASSGKGPRTSSLRSPQAGSLSAPLSFFSWQHLRVPPCQGSPLTRSKAKPELVLVLPAPSALALPPLPASLMQHGVMAPAGEGAELKVAWLRRYLLDSCFLGDWNTFLQKGSWGHPTRLSEDQSAKGCLTAEAITEAQRKKSFLQRAFSKQA